MTIIEIVSTTQSSQGCSCEAHHICGDVVAVDIVVHFCKVQVIIEGEERTAVTVLWLNDGIKRCHVDLIHSHLNKDANAHDEALAQVFEVYSNSSTSDAKCCKHNEHSGILSTKIFIYFNCPPAEPYHPTGIVVEIVGITASD